MIQANRGSHLLALRGVIDVAGVSLDGSLHSARACPSSPTGRGVSESAYVRLTVAARGLLADQTLTAAAFLECTPAGRRRLLALYLVRADTRLPHIEYQRRQTRLVAQRCYDFGVAFGLTRNMRRA